MNLNIKSRKPHPLKLSLVTVILVLIGMLVALVYVHSRTEALQNFNPGNIISDSKMSDYQAMSEAQIRSFIHDRNRNCSSSNSLCLRNYREGGKDAARLIYEAAQEQRINPQVILVTVQKEQGLVTHTSPAQWMYNTAMGYACPDSTPGRCGSGTQGFLRQLTWGSTMYRAILDGGGRWSNRYASGSAWYTPYTLGNNSILWNPTTSCGRSTVNIENRATQALYNYTPYRPNQAALNAGYGTGNSCSSYGNRNFYLYMRDWFDYRPSQQIYFHGLEFTEEYPNADRRTAVQFSLTNATRQPINLGRVKIECISPSGVQHDLPSRTDTTIQPWQQWTYRQYTTFEEEGDWRCYISRNVNGSWMRPVFQDLQFDYDPQITVRLTNTPRLIESLSLNAIGNTSSNTHVQQRIQARFVMRNTSEKYPINVGRHKVQMHHSDGAQYDFPSTPDNNVIQPGQTYTYEETRTLPRTGTYRAFINNNLGGKWNQAQPLSTSNAIVRERTINVQPQVTTTQGLNISEVNTYAGKDIVATFRMTNHGTTPVNVGRHKVQVNAADGTQYDFASTPNDNVLTPGQSYTYSATRNLPYAGRYTAFINNNRDGRWYQNSPASHNSSVSQRSDLQLGPRATMSQSLTLSETASYVGRKITARFSMTNNGSVPLNVGRHKVQMHHSDGAQYDFPSTPDNNVIQPGQTYTYEETRTLPRTGTYRAFINNYRDGVWSRKYPGNEHSGIIRERTLTIRPQVTVTTGLVFRSSNFTPNNQITATFHMTNRGDTPVNVGRHKVQLHHTGNNEQYDFPSTPDNNVIQPGQTYTYEETRTLPRTGTYRAFINNNLGGQWRQNSPANHDSSIVQARTITLR